MQLNIPNYMILRINGIVNPTVNQRKQKFRYQPENMKKNLFSRMTSICSHFHCAKSHIEVLRHWLAIYLLMLMLEVILF